MALDELSTAFMGRDRLWKYGKIWREHGLYDGYALSVWKNTHERGSFVEGPAFQISNRFLRFPATKILWTRLDRLGHGSWDSTSLFPFSNLVFLDFFFFLHHDGTEPLLSILLVPLFGAFQ